MPPSPLAPTSSPSTTTTTRVLLSPVKLVRRSDRPRARSGVLRRLHVPSQLRHPKTYGPLVVLAVLALLWLRSSSHHLPPSSTVGEVLSAIPSVKAPSSSSSSQSSGTARRSVDRFPPRPTSGGRARYLSLHVSLFDSWRRRNEIEEELDWGDGDHALYAAKITTSHSPPTSQFVVDIDDGGLRVGHGGTGADDPTSLDYTPVVAEDSAVEGHRFGDGHRWLGKKGRHGGKGKSRMPQHVYRADGLMEVNPNGTHPIYNLIQRSEKLWEAKSKKASKTLKEAVDEYKRRYHRMPPKNFDKWWDYVVKHKIRLPDEYDQIHHDLEPFYGMQPAFVINQQAEWEHDRDLAKFTVVSKNHKVSLAKDSDMGENSTMKQRARDQLQVLKEVQRWLPDFRATYTAHDGPSQFVGYDMRLEAIDQAATNDYLDPSYEADRRPGWNRACSLTSPMAVQDISKKPDIPELWTRPKTFIWDHKRSMDPCLHVNHIHLNGLFSAHGVGPAPRKTMVPSFSGCTTQLHADILAVAPEKWTEDVGVDPSWSEKKHDTLLWRGSNTGDHFHANGNWNLSQRIRFVRAANEQEGFLDVLKSNGSPKEVVGTPRKASKAEMNKAMMDVGFAGHAIQCEPEICKIVENEFAFKERQSTEGANQWKFILDMDGNGWSARFKRLMSTNSLIFKATIFPEWFTDRVQPWVHFVPVKTDYTDLYDTLSFFRGDEHAGGGSHDDLARKIATQGKEWSFNYWRKEDMVAYMFRLMLEYARVMSYDRDAATFSWEDLTREAS